MSSERETRSVRTRRTLMVLAVVAAVALGVGPAALGMARAITGANDPAPQATATAQTLTWTAGDSTTAYASVTTEAVSGPATLVFENSEATGNTSGMQHTLTFDTVTEGYNHDVDANIIAYPSDGQGGHHEVDVVLSPGTYHFFCSIPGHGQMSGELVVTDGGGTEDTTPPTATASVDGETNADGAYLGVATLSVSASDAGSGVKRIEYALDDGPWTAYNEAVKVTEIGDHTASYRATDVAGNTSEPKQTSFTVVDSGGQDTIPPEVSAMLHGTTNSGGAYVGSAEVMLTATDTGSGVDTVEYALDGGAWTTYTDPVQVSTPGAHTVSYRATDVAGNTSAPGETAFSVVSGSEEDTTPPDVSATVSGSQDAGWSYVGAATVTLTATDAGSGVKSVEYAVDAGSWKAYTDPVRVETAGTHTVKFRATDVAGNVSQVGSTTFSVAPQPTSKACPDPDPNPTVVIADIGTGVRNRVAEGRCTIDDLIQDEARWSSHSDFVAHVKSVLADLYENGVVSGAERTAIVNAAKESSVGSDA